MKLQSMKQIQLGVIQHETKILYGNSSYSDYMYYYIYYGGF